MADNERVWLCHPDTGGVFHCPTEAAEAWQQDGWQPCEAPPEPNLAIAERVAWEHERQTVVNAEGPPPPGIPAELPAEQPAPEQPIEQPAPDA